MCATKSPVPSGTPPVPAAAASSKSADVPAQAGTAATASPGGATLPAAPTSTAYGGAPSQPPAPAMQAMPAGSGADSGAGSGGGAEAGIEAVADSLSASADILHERIMHAIGQRQSGPATAGSADQLAHGITQEAAQALFDQEVLLRQSANHLYVQAAVLASAGLDSVRQELMDVTATARDTLRHVAKVQTLVALTADLVTLAGAIAAGQPAKWPAAIRQVREHVNTLRNSGQT